MDYNELKAQFLAVFNTVNKQEVKLFFSPGRINLIGEHVDNFGGLVFPAAITFGTYAAVTKRIDGKVALYSGNFPADGVIEFALTDLTKQTDEPWSIYVKGVIDVFIKVKAAFIIRFCLDYDLKRFPFFDSVIHYRAPFHNNFDGQAII